MSARTRSRGVLAVALAVALLAAPSAASDAEGPGWSSLDPRARPPGTSASSLVYDEAREQLVLFGGTASASSYVGTWVRGADATWRKLDLAVEPPNRYAPAMTYDTARGEVVLFGGYGDNPEGGGAVPLDDTWVFDGDRWRQAETPLAPSPRAYAAAAYDRVRDRVVLFGGIGIADDGTPLTNLGDTWTWDGQAWTRTETPAAPSARRGSGIAFDETRGEVVLFGGVGTGTPRPCTATVAGICFQLGLESGSPGERDDTWVWDGQAWTERPTDVAPAARSAMGMAYDPARGEVVLYGGVDTARRLGDTWVWDGTRWSDVTPDESPELRFSPAMAADRSLDRVVLYGGHRITYQGADTWGWDGAAWASLEIPTPIPRMAAAMAFDPAGDRALLFGGDSDDPLDDTWTWDGQWRRHAPATAPPARAYAGVATDAGRQEVVVFGGMGGGGDLGDTWVWDGGAWQDRTPAPPSLAPLARRSPAMVYDQARDEVVLFGGWNTRLDRVLADTWTWDGVSWSPRVTLTAPPALWEHRMAYDPVRGEVVLFGGMDQGFAIRGETWTWDGATWTMRQPDRSPPPLAASAMVWDDRAERVVLFGGLGSDAAELWAWDGATWSPLEVPGGPSRRSWTGMAYLPGEGGSLLFGGLSQGYRDDTWRLRLPPGPGT